VVAFVGLGVMLLLPLHGLEFLEVLVPWVALTPAGVLLLGVLACALVVALVAVVSLERPALACVSSCHLLSPPPRGRAAALRLQGCKVSQCGLAAGTVVVHPAHEPQRGVNPAQRALEAGVISVRQPCICSNDFSQMRMEFLTAARLLRSSPTVSAGCSCACSACSMRIASESPSACCIDTRGVGPGPGAPVCRCSFSPGALLTSCALLRSQPTHGLCKDESRLNGRPSAFQKDTEHLILLNNGVRAPRPQPRG
jgi:hypothetical protein